MPHYRATPARASVSLVGSAADRAASRLAAHGVRAGAVLFAAVLTGAAAQLSVTSPWTAVPFTMQPVAVLLAGAVLGARLGALSQALYLVMGVTGASMFALSPVLAPGLARLLGPTGGFLMAFPVAAFAAGWLADRGWTRTCAGALASMAAGLVVLYALGASWLAALAGPTSLNTLWAFAAADVVKAVFAAALLPLAVRAFGPSR
jgi:biotin transport system substrate-specific component